LEEADSQKLSTVIVRRRDLKG